MSAAAEPVRRSLWRRLLRWAAWLFAGLCGLIALLLAVLAAINWQDEALTPEAQAWLAVPPNPVADADNAWLAMIAVGVEKQPGTAVGRQILESLRQNPRLLVGADALAEFGPGWTTDKLYTGFCNLRREGPGLLGRIEARAQELQPVLQANQAALARYAAAIRLPGFFDEQSADPLQLPPYLPAAKAACLVRSELALRLLRGEGATEAEARFARHAHYWLTALQQSHSLLGTMIANAQVQADLDVLLGLEERNPSLGTRLRQTLRADLQGLVNTTGQSMRERVMPSEVRFIAQIFASVEFRERMAWYDHVLFKPHANLNFQHFVMTHPEEVKARCDFLSWHYAFNPTGKVLACIGAHSYQSYFDRLRTTQDAAARLLAVGAGR